MTRQEAIYISIETIIKLIEKELCNLELIPEREGPEA